MMLSRRKRGDTFDSSAAASQLQQQDFSSIVSKVTPLRSEEELEAIRAKLNALNKKPLEQIKCTIAQMQSDKLELMRDLATYEVNACDG